MGDGIECARPGLVFGRDEGLVLYFGHVFGHDALVSVVGVVVVAHALFKYKIL